jgi:hypothetical protein
VARRPPFECYSAAEGDRRIVPDTEEVTGSIPVPPTKLSQVKPVFSNTRRSTSTWC